MRNRARLLVALLGLLTFVLVPGIAAAAVQGQNSTEIALASDAAARATAVSGPVISVAPLSFDYGNVNVGGSASAPFIITNTGDADLTVISIGSDNGSFVETALLPAVIPGFGGTYAFSVAFSPTAGTDEVGTITILSDAANAPSSSILVSGHGNAGPALTPIGNKTFFAFVPQTFTVQATDAGDAIDDQVTFTVSPARPPGLTQSERSDGLGNFYADFSWTPLPSDAGIYTLSICAKDDAGLTDCETITITVIANNRPPVADPGGPYSGSAGNPIAFDGSGSSDPDGGDILSYSWNFGDGATATEQNPSHAYALTGSFLATLTVTDNGSPNLSDQAQTSVTIQSQVALKIYMKLQGNSLPIDGTGDQSMAIQLVNFGQLPLTAIDQASVRLSSSSALGTLPSITPDAKSFSIGDANADGIPDLSMTVSRYDLRQLVGNVPDKSVLTFAVSGSASNGSLALSGTGGPYTMKNTGPNSDPIVNAPATATAAHDQLFSMSISAADPDGDGIASLTAAGAAITAGATFAANATNTAGTLTWTPTLAQVGSYNVTFTAISNVAASSGSATTAISVAERAPVVTAPASVIGKVGTALTFAVTAADPDGDAILTLTASGLPTGATFAAGMFSWTPLALGTYSATFTASNALSGSATTTISVVANAAPVVTAPATKSAPHDALLSFAVTASDADGDAITLTASGLPLGATFAAGTFNWTPTLAQVSAAPYNVTFTATSGTPAQSGSATTAITVTDTAPVVTAPANKSIKADRLSTFAVTAADPDGDAILTLTASGLPTGATFAAGMFSWTPTTAQVSPQGPGNAPVPYNVTFTATSTTLSGSATTAIVVTGNSAPVVTAPATKSAPHAALLTFAVTASDADGDAITLTASGLPLGATFAAGTFNWTPTLAQVSATPYQVTFTATSGTPARSGSASTAITVTDAKPVVAAPASRTIPTDLLSTFSVSASDPDGDAILTLTASGLPSGATFAAGMFSWTPTTAQISPKGPGNDPVPYNVTFTATSTTLSGSATTAIVVEGNSAPVVSAPATKSARHASLLKFDVSASDADGDLVSLSANMSGLPAGHTATFVDNGDETGTFKWTPPLADVSLTPYNVSFTGTSGTPARTGSATTAITVTDARPVVTAPASLTIPANTLSKFVVKASDADGDALTSLTAAGLPSGATATTTADNDSLTFAWTPTSAQVSPNQGSNPIPYNVTFTATSTTLSGSATTAIVVVNNSAPVVTAPLTASTPYNVTVTVAVTASDADGDAIATLTADMSLLPAGNNGAFTTNAAKTTGSFTWKPVLADVRTAPYNVTFTATSGTPALSAAAKTTAITVINRAPVVTAASAITIVQSTVLTLNVSASDPDGAAIASLTAGLSVLPLGHNAVFTPNGTNTAGTLTWTPQFADVSPNSYDVVFTATDATGKAGFKVTAITVVRSINASPAIAAAPSTPFSVKIGPNPFNPETAVKYSLARSGLVSIRIYSVNGRLVRTLKNEFAAAGTHEVRWNGKDDSGRPLSSGTYFVRTLSGSDKFVSKITMLK